MTRWRLLIPVLLLCLLHGRVRGEDEDTPEIRNPYFEKTEWRPSPWFETYVELRGSGRDALSTQLDRPFEGRDKTEFRSGPTYIFYRPPALPNVAGQIGRVDLEEDREWFYDQNLDGIRLFAVNSIVRSEAGVYRTSVNPTDGIVELQKMYFRPVLRGRDFGRRLLALLIDRMPHQGYRQCYLETTNHSE